MPSSIAAKFDPMRVCLVVPYDLSVEGGVKKHAFSLAAALERFGDQVELIGPASGPAELRNTTTFGGVVSLRSNGSENRLGLLTPPLAVRNHLRARAFDVLHVHEPLNPLLPYYVDWWANASARVATFHCFAERDSLVRRFVRRAAAPLLRRFDRAIAVSEPAARYARLTWERALPVIPNGVDLKFFRPPREPARPGLRLLFVGNWTDARKGLDVLLRAHARIRAGGLDARLEVVGGGQPKGPSPSAESGVVYLGRLSEEALRDRLHACDVLVSPALGSESFGMVLIEAMAAGKPVVCSDIEGYRQVAAGTGIQLVPAGDPAALAAALVQLLLFPARARARAAANLAAAERYDWGIVAARVRAEYLAALRGKGGTISLLPRRPDSARVNDVIDESTDAA